MRASNPVESLASAVYTALANSSCIPDIEDERYDYSSGQRGDRVKYMRRPTIMEISVSHFPQMWGSAALGFGGMGGAAMTEAYTTVVTLVHQNKYLYAVFFDGRHAYSVDSPNDLFMQDLKERRISPVAKKDKYISHPDPKNLEEIVELILSDIQSQKAEDHVKEKGIEHHGAGRSIRNKFNLWWNDMNNRFDKDPENKPALIQWFNERDIFMGDDLSQIISHAVKAKLNGEVYDIEKDIASIKKHWTKQGFKDGVYNPASKK